MNNIYVFTFDHIINGQWRLEYAGIDDNIPSHYDVGSLEIGFSNVYFDHEYLSIDEYFDEKVFDIFVLASSYEEAKNDAKDFFDFIKFEYEYFNA